MFEFLYLLVNIVMLVLGIPILLLNLYRIFSGTIIAVLNTRPGALESRKCLKYNHLNVVFIPSAFTEKGLAGRNKFFLGAFNIIRYLVPVALLAIWLESKI